MSTFKLTVVTPSKVIFDDEIDRVIVRTTSGDVGILANHANYVAPLDIGMMKIVSGDKTKLAAVAGGMIKVDKEKTTILSNTCEWIEEIDVARAERSAQRARDYIKNPTELHTLKVANIKLKRALNRIEISKKNK
ncbi:MAG: ATP synthase F1 subunit epsilon [Oscillospiraceae bacterium]